MISQSLATGIVGITVDMTAFEAAMAKVRASMAGLGGAGVGGGVAAGVSQGVAAGMAQGVARGSSQARNAFGQFASSSVASGVASGMAAGVTRGRSGVSAPLQAAVSQAVSAGMAQGTARWHGQARNALGQFTAGPGGGAGGPGGGGSGFGARFGMGALQGLGLSGFATSPAMALGSMAGGGLKAGWEMLAEGVKESAATAIDLQSTFIGIQRVSGESAANVEKFKRTIFDIAAKQSGVSVADLTGIAMAGAKAGITDKEGLPGLETFTRGMAMVRNSVQGVSTEQLTDNMVRVMNLFGKSTDYVQSFGSALARMDNVSTSSAGDILAMSKSLSGTFASLGLGIPQVMAFSSVLSDTGQKNEAGAGAFNQILRKMASESEAMAEKIGMPVEAFQKAIRTDAIGALEMMIRKFKEINDVDPIQGQEFITELGFRGIKAGAAFQQLASMIDEVKKRTAMAVEEETTLGSLLSANALNSEATAGGITKLGNAFIELKDAIGVNFLEPIDLATAALTDLARAAAGNMPALISGAKSAAAGAVGAVGGAAGTAATAVAPGLLGWLVGDGGKAAAGATPAKLPGMTAGAAGKPLDDEAEKNRKAVQEGWRLAALGMEEAVGEDGKKGPAAFVGPPIPNKVRNAMDRAAMKPKPFDDAFVGPPIPNRVHNARDRAALKAAEGDKPGRFSSQMFGDPGDFARHAIQSALSKDPAEKMVERQDRANTFLERISTTLVAGAGTTPDRQRRGPLIMTGEA